MLRFSLLAAALVACLAVTAQAQEEQPLPAENAAAPLLSANPWPYRSYHPDFPNYCRTCYGGGGCSTAGADGKMNCVGGNCHGVRGPMPCAIFAPGIETCRKCGPVGRILFYECKRLACNQKGGDGCHGTFEACGCDSCGNKTRSGPIADFKSRPLGGYASLTGPYRYRTYCYGWKEGPLTYMGVCCGCYESFLSGNFDDRGPLNMGMIPMHDLYHTEAMEMDGAIEGAPADVFKKLENDSAAMPVLPQARKPVVKPFKKT